MLGLGWSEVLLIGIVTLVVVQPKDLPGMVVGIGRFVGRLRAMVQAFHRAMEEAAQEAGLDEIKEHLNGLLVDDINEADPLPDLAGMKNENTSPSLDSSRIALEDSPLVSPQKASPPPTP